MTRERRGLLVLPGCPCRDRVFCFYRENATVHLVSSQHTQMKPTLLPLTAVSSSSCGSNTRPEPARTTPLVFQARTRCKVLGSPDGRIGTI